MCVLTLETHGVLYLPWNLVCVCVLTLETLIHVCELQPKLCVYEPKPNLLP